MNATGNISNSTEPSIYDISVMILNAQLISNICWIVASILGLSIGLLQIATTIMWKPLRKMDQTLIFALAVLDCLKTAAFGALSVRRVFELATGGNDVGSQLSCMVWLSFIVIPSNTVLVMIIVLSVDRLWGVAFPMWYKNRTAKLRVIQITVSCLLGCSFGAIMFIGVSQNTLIPVCALGTSPTDSFLYFIEYFYNFCMYSTLGVNAITCIVLLRRWRNARRTQLTLIEFRKNVQLSAMKVLSAIVLVYLLSSAASTVFLMILNSSGFSDDTRMSYVPISGLLELLRGVFDFPLYVLLVKEYRNGFREVVRKRICCCLVFHGESNPPPPGVGCMGSGPQNEVGRGRSTRMHMVAPAPS